MQVSMSLHQCQNLNTATFIICFLCFLQDTRATLDNNEITLRWYYSVNNC